MEVKIFVACHNQPPLVVGDLFEPIQVGKSLSNQNLFILGDDSGVNISNLNPMFCELTALFWVWKNLPLPDFIGLNHYRRFFAPPDLLEEMNYFKYRIKFWFNGDGFNYYYHFVKRPPLIRIADFVKHGLDKYDVLLPKKYYLKKFNVRQDYNDKHVAADLNILSRLIEYEFPEYLAAFELVMQRDYLYPFNMFICRKEVFVEFCDWVFTVLFKLKDKIDLLGRDTYQQRVFGFLGERLLNVYFVHKQQKMPELKIKELFVCYIPS